MTEWARIAISEYGASIWCDPYLWIPEASRLLRPGGRLIFLVNSVLSILCGFDDETIPAGDNPPYGGTCTFTAGERHIEVHSTYGCTVTLAARLNDDDI